MEDNKLNDLVHRENQEDYEEVDLEELIEQTLSKTTLSTENIEDLQLDKKEFSKGIKDISYIAGQIVALQSIGYSQEYIHEFLLNKDTGKHNMELNKMTCDSNEKVAKAGAVQMEKNSI